MTKIAITGGKGGTGKSMVAISLAVEFAKSRKTTLIDVDVECPNDYLLLSAKRKKYKDIYQTIPKFDHRKCNKCGQCAQVCKQNAIAFVPGKYPAFSPDRCIGCNACIIACPRNAISKTQKKIGTIYTGRNFRVNLITGELKLGELASGEVVADVREKSEAIIGKNKSSLVLIDSAAGIGCPVIASLINTDYIVAVTEPTPSALYDLKRVLYLANHFKIPHGIVINKYSLSEKFCKKIEKFAQNKKIKILGKIPYAQDFVQATVEMRPVTQINPTYKNIFQKIIENVLK